MRKKIFLPAILCWIIFSCSSPTGENVPVIGFLDLLTDETLAQARTGFYDALREQGFDEKKNQVRILYRNAENDQTVLLQSCDYFIAQHVDLIATNPTLSTITAIKRTENIPVFMMVSPSPELMGLTNKKNEAPENLFGVYETLDYLDTSVFIMREMMPGLKRLGTIYNQGEPQALTALHELQKVCDSLGIELISKAANTSNETQMVVQSVLSQHVDAFFALPVNIVFASMEVIVKSCRSSNVPVFAGETGLVKRGAVAAYGADMYQWGHQTGMQAAQFLKTKKTKGLRPEIVKVRRRILNDDLK